MKQKKNKENSPFSWDLISIEKYYQIADILNDNTTDEITKNVQLVALILDKEEEEIYDMDIAEAGNLISQLTFLNKFEMPSSPSLKVKLPNYNLAVQKDLTKMTVSQYLDYTNFSTMPLREGIEKLLSVFLIPEGCKYNNGYDIIDLQKEIREYLPFITAESFLHFFLKGAIESLIHSLNYCTKKLKREKNQQKKEILMKKIEETKQKIRDLTHLDGCY